MLLKENVVMRTYDFAPLYRSTVGFDRLFDLLDSSAARPDWPPYDIEKKSENEYRITMAVAGFKPDEIELTQHGVNLYVTGQKKDEAAGRQMLHHGIASRSFKQTFSLADHVKVAGAALSDGLLSVDLVREVPEQLKPRRIEIGATASDAVVQDNRALNGRARDNSPQPVAEADRKVA
jgi:molecular chaperone IbpA